MVKILSSSGRSLSDLYDVQGSIVGIEQLESREVSLVHEMGGTIFSERYSTFTRRAITGDISQSTAFNVVLEDLPSHFFNLIAISVLVSTAARVSNASVAIRNPLSGREMPIWIWASATDAEIAVRFSNDGAAVATGIFLQPNLANVQLPQMMAGAGQPQHVSSLALRGFTSAFGAGTVEVTAFLHVEFAALGALSSRGLPFPSW